MKNTILTLAAALVLLTSCTKEDDLQPVVDPIIPVVVEPCLDVCGTVISFYGFGVMEHRDGVDGWTTYADYNLTLATSCDTVEVVRNYSSYALSGISGSEVCFGRWASGIN